MAATIAGLNVLIGGGSGFIGTHVTKALEGAGHRVTLISRSPAAPGGRPTVTWSQIEEQGLPSGTDAVFNFSGALVLDPAKKWTPEFQDEVRRSRIHFTRLLRDACASSATPPRVFVSSSAIGIYPTVPDCQSPTAPAWEENSEIPTRGRTWMQQLCIDWEQAAALPAEAPTRLVTVRWGVVLAAGGGALATMRTPFALGLGGPVGGGRQAFSWIHIDDAAQLCVEAVSDSSYQGVYNAVAPQITSNSQFATAFGAALSRPAVLPAPAFAMRWIFGEDRASMLLEGANIIPRRLVDRSFPFRFAEISTALKTIVNQS